MSGLPPDFAASFMDDYFAESDEHLAAVRRNLLLLESAIDGDAQPGVVEELFRRFHSVKGISAMVDLKEAERLAHEMESCLGLVRDRPGALNAAGFEALVDGTTALEQVIAARRSDDTIPDIAAAVDRLRRVGDAVRRESTSRSVDAAAAVGAPAPADRWRVTFVPSADLVGRGINVDAMRARLSAVARIDRVAPRVTEHGAIAFDFDVSGVTEEALRRLRDAGVTYERTADTEVTAGSPRAPVDARPLRAAETAAPAANFVRVDLTRLDDLMRLVGDLVVTRARLEESINRLEDSVPAAAWRPLQEGADAIERQLRDLREGVMRVRLVPVAEIFRRMPFVVRDLARDNGKRVRLETAGQGTEIDKFLVERMMDPVLHLVRNAVSHGLEGPEERVAAGKVPEGTIRLGATTVAEAVVLEVADDGRGLDPAAITERARARGVAVAERDLDGQALLDVICAPGFSTREEADRESGRGVGLSVVRDAVQELAGTLTVETAPGRGTTFRMTLPLTLAITDALIVHVGDRTFAVPQTAVHEVAEVEAGALRAIENNELLTHRGAPLPVYRLGRLFALEPPAADRMHMLVVGTGGGAAGLLVDRISGQREIVVKTLRDPLVAVAGIAGATELGDGRLILILDVAGLTRRLRGRTPPLRAAV
jgi:two-component system, chemotaxis family, sensor kinase CheA